MIHHPVRHGYIGENYSGASSIYLIQTGDGYEDSRVVLTREQLQRHVERCQKLLSEKSPLEKETECTSTISDGTNGSPCTAAA